MRRRRSESPLLAATRRAGVTDPRVLDAISTVPREGFVPSSARGQAQEDRPLPIGQGQTTSQPSLVAMMVAALGLTGSERVLEIGTGLGYQAAVLSRLAAEVHTVERHPELADQARANLAAAGVTNVSVVVADGSLGLADEAPFDATIIAAATPEIPPSIVEQLRAGGRVVAPVSHQGVEEVRVYVRDAEGLVLRERVTGARFVPLIAGSD